MILRHKKPLLEEINNQLEKVLILVKQGVIIDASITPTLNKPKGKNMFEITNETPSELKEFHKKGVDREGNWTKKGGKLRYGYKKHYMCDEETSIVLSVCTSAPNEHDSKYMEKYIEKIEIPPGSSVYADKGYYVSPNSEMLSSKRLKNGIQSVTIAK